jgi:uncharacterized protein
MNEKIDHLQDILRSLDPFLVAYSGGVDSTLLLKIAQDTLQKDATAVIVDSPTLPRSELEDAKKITAELGINLIEIQSSEMSLPEFLDNSSQRCYYCKDHRYQMLSDFAVEKGFKNIIDGSNHDDLSDHRPGQKAAIKNKVRSPLQEAGFTKTEIRELAREKGLLNWNKPSSACLASRIPYGTKITPDLLNQVEQAEDFLSSLGYKEFRVRHHGDIARIEVPATEFDRILQQRSVIFDALEEVGFSYITLDIKGFRSGSMNEVIE